MSKGHGSSRKTQRLVRAPVTKQPHLRKKLDKTKQARGIQKRFGGK